MGILTKISEAIGIGGSESYAYECDGCGERFESTVPSPALVSCPECGADDPTALPEEG